MTAAAATPCKAATRRVVRAEATRTAKPAERYTTPDEPGTGDVDVPDTACAASPAHSPRSVSDSTT